MDAVPRPRPKLMVIGDSLPQGCRSLSVKADFCAQSWPARMAQAQGWEFTTPDFPRAVLFDLEAEIRLIDTFTLSLNRLRFEGFESRFRRNLGAWLEAGVESAFRCFDNLALAGARVHDLYTRTALTSAADVAGLTPDGAATRVPLKRIGDLHIAVNGRYVLNPSRDPAFDGFTQLDWVRERKPELLVVQIGHNHGLYEVGSRAAAVAIDGGDDDRGTYWAQFERLAGDLARLPAEVGTVLVALLPKVGAVANLRALGPDRADGYAASYEPVFSPSIGVLSGEGLAAVDAAIRAANERIRTAVLDAAAAAGTEARVKFLDVYALFEQFDYKNSLDPARRVDVGDGAAVDNRYLETALTRRHLFSPPVRRLVAGGFQSADGMHPSGVGHARLASEAMALLGLPHDRAALLRRAFAEDALLATPPGELNIVVRLLGVLRELERLNQFVSDTTGLAADGPSLTDALRAMRQVFIR